MDTDTELAQLLTAAVAETPGVTAVYASGSPVRAVVRTLAEAVGAEDGLAPKISVHRHQDDSLTIGVTIGVSAGTPVPATTRLVGDAVRGVLLTQAAETPVREIDVRVCRIDERAVPEG